MAEEPRLLLVQPSAKALKTQVRHGYLRTLLIETSIVIKITARDWMKNVAECQS
jgi:hypothetical protein